MGFLWKKLRRGILKEPLSLVFLFILVFWLLYFLYLGLPEVTISSSVEKSETFSTIPKTLDEAGIGEFGRMMVDMLPDDLAFTIFLPSEKAFERILKLQANDSLSQQKIDDTFAIISRVMGFSTVAKQIPSGAVLFNMEISFDSISGFRLHIWKDLDGTLVVNGVRSENVDISKAKIVVHKMGGVIMDAEFEHSFSPDDED